MPVQKFRSIEDMPDVPRRQSGNPELARTMRQLWDFGRRSSHRRFGPGVYRFRSIEEIDAALNEGGDAHGVTVSADARIGRT